MRKEIRCLFLLFLFGCAADHEVTNHSDWEYVRMNGEGMITLAYVPSEGFSYEQEGGHLTGVTIELIRDFVGFLHEEYDVNVAIHYKPMESFSEFYRFIRDAESGVFGVANVTITEARREELQFSPPYMTNIATLITHSEIEEISKMEEITEAFAGLDALAFEGTLHEERLRQVIIEFIPDAGIEFAHSNSEIIARTEAENRYFAYVDIYNYWRASERGASLRRHAAGDESSEQFGVISPLGSDWDEVMEEFFHKDGGYIRSSRFQTIMREHLGEELAGLLISQSR